MEQFELQAERRTDVGKGASRRLRRTGKLPGIIYGTKRDVLPITLSHDDVAHQLEHEAFFSHILTISVGDKNEKVVLKDLQRHPHKPFLLHIDFQRIDESAKLTMRVPFHFINEDRCVGVKQGGGVVSHIMTELEISCLPKDLPEYIEVDLAEVDVGETVHLSDLELPDGVEISALLHGGDSSQSVANVIIPRVIEEEEELAAEAELAAGIAEVESEIGEESNKPEADESSE